MSPASLSFSFLALSFVEWSLLGVVFYFSDFQVSCVCVVCSVWFGDERCVFSVSLCGKGLIFLFLFLVWELFCIDGMLGIGFLPVHLWFWEGNREWGPFCCENLFFFKYCGWCLLCLNGSSLLVLLDKHWSIGFWGIWFSLLL